MEPTSDQLSLQLSDRSSEALLNTSTEVIDGDEFERDVDIYQDVKVEDDQRRIEDIAADEENLVHDREAEEYIQQFSPELGPENVDKELATIEEDQDE